MRLHPNHFIRIHFSKSKLIFLLMSMAFVLLLNGFALTAIEDIALPFNINSAGEYGRIPLTFEANQGQADPAVHYLARGDNFDLFLTSQGAIFSLETESAPEITTLQFLGQNPEAHFYEEDHLFGQVNYLLGNDPSKWITAVSTHSKITRQNIYPGIDVTFYGNQRNLEYDFIVSPQIDPSLIEMAFDNANAIEQKSNGELLIQLDSAQLTLKAPFTYQLIEGAQKEISSQYLITPEQTITFQLGDYDPNYSLIIDPILVYSSYLGGTGTDAALDIKVNTSGEAYITGYTSSLDFPVTAGAFDSLLDGGQDIFVSKLNTAGTVLLFTTYIGGTATEAGRTLDIDSAGNIYISGETGSLDFPTSAGAFATTKGALTDGFVIKLDSSGSNLLYGTYLGGNDGDTIFDLKVDSSGSVHVVGETQSSNFPTTAGAFDETYNGGTCTFGTLSRPCFDTFITKLDSTGSTLQFSTYWGGSTNDRGRGIELDSSGNVYLMGNTDSIDLPTSASAFDTSFNGGTDDIFVAKLDSTGSSLVYGTYLGGSGNESGSITGGDIAIDSANDVYITAQTGSADFPVTVGTFDETINSSIDAFVTKINSTGSALVYSTFLGGGFGDYGWGIEVDADHNAYLTGQTAFDFPTTSGTVDNPSGNNTFDTYITVLNEPGTDLIYSTLIAGSANVVGGSIDIDANRGVYVAGQTFASDIPIENGFQPVFAGGSSDSFIIKLSIPCVVTNTNDSGAGSFREAINCSNSNSGQDTIIFNIPGTGPHTIAVQSALPTITDSVIIDGFTQPGASVNTAVPGNPLNTTLMIDLDGTNAGNARGLYITAGNSTVRGLAINDFALGGILLQTNGNNTIEGNFIGTDVTGVNASGSGPSINILNSSTDNQIGGATASSGNIIGQGIQIQQSSTGTIIQGNFIGVNINGDTSLGWGGDGIFVNSLNTTIGGNTAGSRNIISGNGVGIRISSSFIENNTIQGNYIGTDVSGSLDLGNSLEGLRIPSSNNLIGGPNAGEGNVISGNDTYGIFISDGANNNLIQGNFIGTDASGTTSLGNGSDGIYMGAFGTAAQNNVIGGSTAGAGNLISANGNRGIFVTGNLLSGTIIQGNQIGTDLSGTLPLGNQTEGITIATYDVTVGGSAIGEGNTIAFNNGFGVFVSCCQAEVRGNNIFANNGLGIDLSPSGVNANDAGDGDSGANALQNYPVLTAVSSIMSGTTIEGTLNSLSSANFALDFFANSSCDGSGHGEGETYLGSATVATNGSGDVTFSESLATAVSIGDFITATATDPTGNTSEFSSCMAVVAANSLPVASDDTYNGTEDTSLSISAPGVLANDSDPDGTVLGFGNRALVLNQNADSVTIMNVDNDPPTVITTVPVGNDPLDGTISPNGRLAVVSNNSDDTVSILDMNLATPVVITTLAVGSQPTGIAISPDSETAVVANANTTTLSIIDLTQNPPVVANTITVGSGLFGEVHDAVFDASGDYAVVAFGDSFEGEILVVDMTLATPSEIVSDRISVGNFPLAIGTNPNRTLAAVNSISADETAVLDLSSYPFSLVGTVSVGPNPGAKPDISADGIAVVPDADTDVAYIIDADAATPTVITTIPVGDGPRGAGILDGDNVALVANRSGNSISRIDLSTLTALSTVNGITSANRISIHEDSGDLLTAVLDTAPSQGTLTLNSDGSFDYTPNADFCGSDSFTYHANDGTGDSNSAIVTLNIACVNDAPVAQDDTNTVSEDGSLSESAPGVLGNDLDAENDALTAVLDSTTSNGTLTFSSDGSYTYTPNADFCGTDSFTYHANDGQSDSPSATATITVICINDAPVAVDDAETTAEDTASTISVLNNDTDIDGDTLSVAAITQPTNGTVVINGDNTVTYTPSANFSGTDSFTYDISDNNGGSDSATVTITVTPVNDAPTANDDTVTTPEDTALLIDVLDNDEDIDGDTLSITAVTQPTNGTVINNGTDVTYTPDADFFGSDSFTYTISDGNGGTDTAIVNITVQSVNDDPSATDDSATTDEDTAVNITVLSNDSDVDGDTITVDSITPPSNGTAVLNGDDSLTYTPNADINGFDSFTYTISDGNGGSDTATVNITITPVNDDPVATDDTDTTNEDTAITLTVLANDSDLDGDTLTVSSTTSPSQGAVVINGDNTVTYTPNAEYNGSDSFTYTISDGNGGTDSATVNITITPVNDVPTALDDTAVTDEDTPTTITVLSNDSDVDGDSLTVESVTAPANGTAVINLDNSITYTPNADYNGADSFTYTVNDGNGDTDTATVTLTITAVNDNPVTGDDAVVTPEDVPITIAVLANDSDIDGDSLSTASVAQPPNGTTTINPDSSITYSPDASFFGTDTFFYTVSDGQGGTDTGQVDVTITAENDNPVANDDTASTAEDTAVTIDVLGNDSDIDGDIPVVDSITSPNHGTLINNGSDVTYTPNANYNGSDSFVYTVSDGNGGSDTATVNITVTAVNDAPIAQPDAATTSEDTATTITVLVNDTDADGDSLTVTAVIQPANGTVINNGTNVTYTPNADYFGNDSFTYTVADGNGGTDTTTVDIVVTPVNDAPIGTDDSGTTDEDTAVNLNILANDSDVENDSLTITAVSLPASGTAVLNGDQTVTYTPNANFNGADSFTYTVEDGQGGATVVTVNVTVTPVNDAPIASDDSATGAEDGSIVIDVLANDSDIDGDALTVAATTTPSNGSVVINLDQTVTYTPNGNFNGADSFEYTIDDGNGGSDTATVSLTITPINDAPTATDDTASTAEDSAVVIDVLANDSDVDGDSLNIDSVTPATNGTVAINGDDTITYTPSADFNGADSFTYTIDDGNGGLTTAVVNITVTPVNDAPVAVDDSATTLEDDSVTIFVLTNDNDVDGDTLTVSSATSPANGAVTLTPVSIDYIPDADYCGTDTFDYTVDDGNGETATATVTVTVTCINDDPVAIDDGAITNVDTGTTIAVLSNDFDVDLDTLTVSSVTSPIAGGTAVVNGDNTITYTPLAGFSGTDSFDYTIDDGNGGTATAVVTVEVLPDEPQADLSVTKTDSEDPIAEEQFLTYTIVVTNNGPMNADAVTLVDTLPALVTFDSYTATQGTCLEDVEDTIICDLGALAVNDSIEVTITVLPDETGEITNSVTVSGDKEDPNPANNSADETTTIVSGNFCAGHPATIIGTPDDDVIIGTPGDDVIIGRAGKDVIDGAGGNDIICGGRGKDTIYGGDGDDYIKGGRGDDWLEGGDGNDELRGGRGDDILKGQADDDILKGRRGEDELYGGSGHDTLRGGRGEDVLKGGTGNDTLYGGRGEDELYGGDDDDELRGGDGDDLLKGQDGHDTLYGKKGDDSLFGGKGDDFLDGGNGHDDIDGGQGYDGCANGESVINCEW